MLFPVTQAYEDMRKQQDEDILEHGVEGVQDIIYFKQTSAVDLPSPSARSSPTDRNLVQTVANACGTFALLHTLANTDVPIGAPAQASLLSRASHADTVFRPRCMLLMSLARRDTDARICAHSRRPFDRALLPLQGQGASPRCLSLTCPLPRYSPRRTPTARQTPLERAQLLTQSNELERVHEETAQTGQTAVRPPFSFLPLDSI